MRDTRLAIWDRLVSAATAYRMVVGDKLDAESCRNQEHHEFVYRAAYYAALWELWMAIYGREESGVVIRKRIHDEVIDRLKALD